jgi:hypothetical protein
MSGGEAAGDHGRFGGATRERNCREVAPGKDYALNRSLRRPHRALTWAREIFAGPEVQTSAKSAPDDPGAVGLCNAHLTNG